MITLSVDPTVGTAYIKLSDEPIVETVEVTRSVQVDLGATNTVVGVELLSLTAEIPVETLDRSFSFPPLTGARMLARIWPSFTYGSEGQGHAYVPPPPAPVLETAN
jgi:uncharacterized protein YuzE